MDGVERLLASAFRADNDGFLPFFVCDAVVGWVRPAFADALRRFAGVFRHDAAGGVHMDNRFKAPEERSHAMAAITRELVRAGAIKGWRDELYAVRRDGDAHGEVLLTIERAAARAFGITSQAVHVNGLAAGPDGWSMWIARRSLAKPIDPGMLDNMIGGGLPHGLSVRETVVKEAWEEAGLAEAVVARAGAGRRLRIRRAVPEGLQSELIFVHDLVLPPGVAPRNVDGEVSEFRLLPIPTVIAMLREGGRITPDASLVILDWLDRQDLLPLPDLPAVRAILGS